MYKLPLPVVSASLPDIPLPQGMNITLHLCYPCQWVIQYVDNKTLLLPIKHKRTTRNFTGQFPLVYISEITRFVVYVIAPFIINIVHKMYHISIYLSNYNDLWTWKLNLTVILLLKIETKSKCLNIRRLLCLYIMQIEIPRSMV